jgi:hypothetical protein
MRGVRVALVVAIVVAILLYASILVSGGGLGRRDGFTGVGASDNIFTLFYMDGCPHCEDILPDFNKWAAAGQILANDKPVKIRKLEREEAGPLLDQKGVKGFPTFILTTANGTDIEYSGDRSTSGYEQFILKNVK